MAGGAAAVFGAAAWAVRGKSSSLLAPSIWRGPRERPAIALTFDDGPCEATEELLTVLHHYNVTATFFQIGRNAERLPQTARAVSAAGHEIGNHSYSHAPLWLRTPGFIEDEVALAQQALTAIHGTAPRWFRAPFGVRWVGLGAVQAKQGLYGAMWSTIGGDYRLPSEAVRRRLLRGAANGAIFCLHDGRELASSPDIRNTTEAVRSVIPILLDKGFRFETLTQLACPINSPSIPNSSNG